MKIRHRKYRFVLSTHSEVVAYLRKMIPMAKFKCAHFSIIDIYIGKILRKINQENKVFQTENMCLFFIKTFQQKNTV